MTSQTCQIEPVSPIHYIEAIRFLAGGGRKDLGVARMAESIIGLVHSRTPEQVSFWWARRGHTTIAAALVVDNPGRTGMLLHSPPGPAVDSDALAQVAWHAGVEALSGGMSFVQALLEPSAVASQDVLIRAGYVRLAELIYMSKPLIGPFAPDVRENEYTWRHYGQFNEEELASVIALTYQQSLDCQGLSGVRKLPDVIVSHKTSGMFRPQAWWIATSQGLPAGCILINDYIQADSADVVYLGVTPQFRGRGLSAVMLNMAGRFAVKRGMGNLTLAVDSANTYAYKVYATDGFGETMRRLAYAMIAGDRTK